MFWHLWHSMTEIADQISCLGVLGKVLGKVHLSHRFGLVISDLAEL